MNVKLRVSTHKNRYLYVYAGRFSFLILILSISNLLIVMTKSAVHKNAIYIVLIRGSPAFEKSSTSVK